METRRCSVIEKPAPNTRVVREVADDVDRHRVGAGLRSSARTVQTAAAHGYANVERRATEALRHLD
jgi:hypothetical protein